MSALDDAREDLAKTAGWEFTDNALIFRDDLAALVAEAAGERAQLGELLMRCARVHRERVGGDSGQGRLGTLTIRWYAAGRQWGAVLHGLGDVHSGLHDNLDDALRALLAKAEAADA